MNEYRVLSYRVDSDSENSFAVSDAFYTLNDAKTCLQNEYDEYPTGWEKDVEINDQWIDEREAMIKWNGDCFIHWFIVFLNRK